MRTLCYSVAALALCLATPASVRAASHSDLVMVDWMTMMDAGAPPMVQFHLRFYNPHDFPSPPNMYQVFAQEAYGAFVPNAQMIQQGETPTIAPMSFFDVFFEVELSALPPPPATTTNSAPAGDLDAVTEPGEPCPPDDHWDGNIDVVWGNAGGTGQANFHIGTLQVCPGDGKSYIHLLTGCLEGAAWSIDGVCPGWSATLVNEDYTPAPAALPPGWTGWICISADASVPVASTCCFTIDLMCGEEAATIELCAHACQCAVQNESSTWGRLKGWYR